MVQQLPPLTTQTTQVPPYNKEALIAALRADQTGKTTFLEFLKATWEAGVIWYRADFEKREVTYGGADDQSYTETYPAGTL